MFDENRIASGELAPLEGYARLNANNIGADKERFEQWLAGLKSEHTPDKSRVGISAGTAAFLDMMDALKKEAADPNYKLLRTGSELDDTTVRSRKHRDAAHDLMFLGSTEQAIKDQFALNKIRKTETETLSVDEAFAYAKERGVDTLRVDKPIGKNELEYKINREITRRELTQELANYQDTKDYSALQKALLLGAYVSGSFTGYELLATGVLSFAGGVGFAALLEKAAHAAKTGNSIYKGVVAAQTISNARKAARMQGNAIKLVNQANAALADVKKADFATKLVYDAYNFGKPGMLGQRASHTTVTIPMMIDGALGEVLPALIKQHTSNEMGGEPLTTKDTLTAIAMGGLVSGVVPHAGTLVRAVKSAPGKVIDTVSDVIYKRMQSKHTNAILRGYEAVAPAVDKAKEKTSSYTQEIMDTINKEYPVDDTYIDEIVQTVGANLTEEEAATKNAIVALALETGGDPSVVNRIPFKTEYYSKILGMYDYIKSNIDATYKDFVAALQSRGIKLGATKALARNNLVEGLAQNPILEDLRQMMKSSGWGIGYRIASEKGAIGSKYAFAMCQEDALEFLHNIYKARMLEDTPEGQEALVAAQRMQDKLLTLKHQLEEIVDTYDVIQATNKQAKEEGKATVYSYKGGGQDLYRLADGSIGSLRKALKEIALLMLPAKQQDEYAKAVKLMSQVEKEVQQAGHPLNLTDARKAEIAEAEQLIAEVEQWQNEVVSFLASETQSRAEGYKNLTFFNLARNVKGSASDTAYLNKTIDELNKAIDSNDALLNLRKAYDDEVGDPEQLINRLKDEEIPAGMNNTQITAETLRDMATDADTSTARLTATKADFTAWVSSETGTKVMNSIDELTKIVRQQVNKQQRLTMGFFNMLRQNIMGADIILDMSKADIVNKLVTAFSKREEIAKLLNNELLRSKLGQLTPKAMTKIFKDSIPEFEKAIGEVLDDIISEAHLPQQVLGTQRAEIIHRAVTSFTEAINKGDIKLKLGDMVDKTAAEEATEAVKAATDNVIEQVVEEPVVEGAAEASRVWEAILDPFMDTLRKEFTDMQNANINALHNTAKIWERCLATPGKMSEVILGAITTTYLPTRGASESIENISSVATDWALFGKRLDEADKAHKFGGLREWAEDQANIQEISENVAMLRAKNLGLLNKTELDQMTTSSKGYQVAKALLDSEARIAGLMYNVGSNKTNIMSLCASHKLRQANTKWLPLNFLNTPLVRNIVNIIDSADELLTPIKSDLQRLLPTNNSKEAKGYTNHVLYRLERLDLQKHFNSDGHTRIDLNEVRDALLGENRPGVGSAFDQLIHQHGVENVQKAVKKIVDGLIGSEDGTVTALLPRNPHMGARISAKHASFTAKYLNDIEDRFFYKNFDALKDDIKYLGYDDLRSWFEEGIGTGKKAYAVLAKAGFEPYLFFDNLREMARLYAAGPARTELGEEAAIQVAKNVNSRGFDRALEYAIEHMTGTFEVPATTGIMIAQGIRRIITSPMLMFAGPKSLTDYNNQFQSAVNMGFANVLDFKSRGRIAGKLFKACKQTDILRSLYLSTAMRANTLNEMMFGTPIGLNTGSNAKGILDGVTEATSMADVFDQLSKAWSSTLVDKWALVGPLTKFNRANAAMTMMEFVGDLANKTWKDISSNEKLVATLERFGFTEYEWDNIFSKDAMSDLTSYIKGGDDIDVPDFGKSKLFFPDLIENISDESIATHLKAQKKPVNSVSISRYRQELIDKASALINSSADEMTTIPTTRIQGVASMHMDPNSWAGFFFSSLTQFQSFPIGMAFYQLGRKLATFMDRTDPMFNRILMNAKFGFSAAGSFMAYWAESAIITGLLLEAVDFAKGNTQSLFNPDGSINTDALAHKATRALFEPLAIASIFLDASITSIEKGRGQGGGLALPVFPAASAVTNKLARVTHALTSDAVEGERVKAVGAAVAQNIIDDLGIPNSIYLKPWTTMFVTDHLQRMQQGDNWYSRQDSRIDRGFQPSYAQMLMEQFDL